MAKADIQITMVDKKGSHGCHYGHKIGDSFSYNKERGKVCPMVMHVAFPYIDIMRYGGTPPQQKDGSILFSCPDVNVLNIFKLEFASEIHQKIAAKIIS